MTDFEQAQLAIYKKTLVHFCRLSMPRERLTRTQAAFALGCSENTLDAKYVVTGKIRMVYDREEGWAYSGESIRQYIRGIERKITSVDQYLELMKVTKEAV